MFKSFIKVSDIEIEEPELMGYIKDYQLNVNNCIDNSIRYVINDLSSRRLELKKICTPLTLIKDVDVYDKVERKMLVINVSAISSDCILTLKGRNKLTDTYTTLYSEILSTIGETNYFITNPFLYYEITLSNTMGLSYDIYLVENAFDLPLLKYTLYLVCKLLYNSSNEVVYNNKAVMYLEEYRNLMNEIIFTYNNTLSTEVTDTDSNVQRMRLIR